MCNLTRVPEVVIQPLRDNGATHRSKTGRKHLEGDSQAEEALEEDSTKSSRTAIGRIVVEIRFRNAVLSLSKVLPSLSLSLSLSLSFSPCFLLRGAIKRMGRRLCL